MNGSIRFLRQFLFFLISESRGLGPNILWAKFFWRAKIPFRKGVSYRQVFWDDFSLMEGDWGIYREEGDLVLFKNGITQNIFKNGPFENQLIKSSKRRVESGQLRLFTKEGVILSSSIFRGSERSLSDLNTLTTLGDRLLRKAKKDGLEGTCIELNHTHPALEVYYSGRGFQGRSLHPLSKQDLKTAKGLHGLWPVAVKIKALSYSGHYYQVELGVS